HQLDMLHGNVIFEVAYFTHDNQKRVYHRKSGENRTSNKVWRENRRMPARDYRCREVKGYNCMDRKHKWRCQTSKYQGYFLKTLPIFCSSRPSKTQYGIDFLLERLDCSIANHRKIGQ